MPNDSHTHGTSIHTCSLLGHPSLSGVSPVPPHHPSLTRARAITIHVPRLPAHITWSPVSAPRTPASGDAGRAAGHRRPESGASRASLNLKRKTKSYSVSARVETYNEYVRRFRWSYKRFLIRSLSVACCAALGKRHSCSPHTSLIATLTFVERCSFGDRDTAPFTSSFPPIAANTALDAIRLSVVGLYYTNLCHPMHRADSETLAIG